MSHDLTCRQRAAWTFAALSAPVCLHCAGLGWGQVLAAAAWTALFCAVLDLCAQQPLPEAIAAANGRISGPLLLLEAAWLVLQAARTAAEAGRAFPEERLGVLSAVCVLAGGAFACLRGVPVGGRFGAVCAILLTGLFGLVLLAAASDLRWDWCRPVWRPGQIGAALLAIAPVLAGRFLPVQAEKKTGGGLVLLALCPVAVSLVSAGILSPEQAAAAPEPFYLMSKSLSLLGVMQRFEPLVSCGMLLGSFCLAALELSAAERCCGAVFGTAAPNRAGILLAAAALAGSFVISDVPQAVWTAGAAICWGAIPLEAQLIAAIKKWQKNQK